MEGHIGHIRLVLKLEISTCHINHIGAVFELEISRSHMVTSDQA